MRILLMTDFSAARAFAAAGFAPERCEEFGVYPRSVHREGACVAFIWREESRDWLIASEGLGFTGRALDTPAGTLLAAPMNHENACVLRERFAFTAPVRVLKNARTAGTGDRLGIATPGHVRVFEQYDAYPILAQQSMRELRLTGRTFEQVLDDVSYAVFREDFRRGFGADGDHLKTPEEVSYALSCGYTMITLDCSEHIHAEEAGLTDEAVAERYTPDEAIEARYLGKRFPAGAYTLTFSPELLRRTCLIYKDAIDFAASVYQRFLQDGAADFEISIDETSAPTLPEQHFFIANELYLRGIRPVSVAPRFVGEFQKGIDYLGELAAFERDFAVHAAIADQFGYKLSIHSGSDKFSVFPTIGKYTHGRFHLKTAGTSWLEAMAVVAEREPALYREIHAFILPDGFYKAAKYYHVTTNLDNIPPLSTVSDAELARLLETNDDERQLVHINYGLILNEKAPDGSYRFRDRLYRLWRQHENAYMQRLEHHIGRHLELLYSGFSAENGQNDMQTAKKVGGTV